jgi:iron(III) transport system substrate-binding protein
MDRREFMIGAGATIAAASSITSVQAAAPALPSYYPADYPKIIEASKAEPNVVMYTSFGGSFWNPITELIKSKYPWIVLQNTDLTSSEILERYRLERAGNARTADFMAFVGPVVWHEFATKNDMIDYVSPESPHLPDWTKKQKGVNFCTVDCDVFVWNKLLMKGPPPTSLEELVAQCKADPEFFRGRISTYPIYHDPMYFIQFKQRLAHYGDKLWDWLEVLGPLTRVQRSGATMFEKTLVGENVLSYFTNQNQSLRAEKDPAKEKIFGWSFVKDGTATHPHHMGIPVGSSAQNSAKLVLDTFLSREGQMAISNGGRMSFRPDVGKADIKPGFYTYQMALEQVGEKNLLNSQYEPDIMKDQDAITARWRKIFAV